MIVILIYISKPFDDKFYIVGNSLVIALSLMATLSGIYAYRIYGYGSIQGKSLLFLTFGLFFWFLGETTWGIYEIATGIESPLVSIADIFWILGYPFFLLGIYFICKMAALPLGRKNKYFLTFILFLSILLCSYLIYPTLISQELIFLEKLTLAFYVVFDCILLFATIFAIIYLKNTKFLKVWILVFLALFLATVADIYYMNLAEMYQTGNLIDILWDLDYLIMSFGLFYMREKTKEIFSTEVKRK